MNSLQRQKNKWLSYSDLAWTETIICTNKEIREESLVFCNAILKHAKPKPKTLLHIGCGTGMNDIVFKKHFKVTGVDISPQMLKHAKKRNPKAHYILGDMRKVRLKKKFDVVIFAESIGYMTTKADLKKAIHTANLHLNPNGVLLVFAQVKDTFKENNFVDTGKKNNARVTIFENNCITSKNSYEATIVYLIRKNKKLSTFTDKHIIGLFESKTWIKTLKECGFLVKTQKANQVYDRYVMEDGVYPQTLFVCKKN